MKNNKLIFLLPVLFLLISCNSKPEIGKVEETNFVTITKNDYEILIPDFLIEVDNLNAVASLQYSNKEKEFFSYITTIL